MEETERGGKRKADRQIDRWKDFGREVIGRIHEEREKESGDVVEKKKEVKREREGERERREKERYSSR